MKGCNSRFAIVLVAILLLVIAIIFFVATIALGIVGNVVATQGNICLGQRIGTGCIPVDDELSADVNVTAIQRPDLPLVVNNISDSQHYLYWLIGATFCGLLFVFIGTLCVWLAAWIFYSITKRSEEQAAASSTSSQAQLTQPVSSECSSSAIELQPAGELVSYGKPIEMRIEGLQKPEQKQIKKEEDVQCGAIDKCLGFCTSSMKHNLLKEMEDKEKTEEKKGEKKSVKEGPSIYSVEDGLYELVEEYDEKITLDEPDVMSLIKLFLFFFFGILSILCLLWAFGIAFNRSSRSEDSVTPFVLANVLSGILAPVLFFISIFIGISFFDYYTCGKVQQHLILTKLLPSLEYEESDKTKHWVIANSLLLTIKEQPTSTGENKCSCLKNIMPNSSTALLSLVIVLSMMVSFSYFIDISLVSQVTVDSCTDSNINIQYSCFKGGSLSPVDCTSNNESQPLHCFRFYKFGADMDFITSVSSAFAFYLLTNRVLGFIVFAMKISSISKQKLKLQGALFVGLSFVLVIITFILIIMWLTGVTSESVSLLAYLDVLNLAQMLMFSLFIMVIGLLAQEGKWVQKRPAKIKNVTFCKASQGTKDTSLLY